jgi:hypothetical protein
VRSLRRHVRFEHDLEARDRAWFPRSRRLRSPSGLAAAVGDLRPWLWRRPAARGTARSCTRGPTRVFDEGKRSRRSQARMALTSRGPRSSCSSWSRRTIRTGAPTVRTSLSPFGPSCASRRIVEANGERAANNVEVGGVSFQAMALRLEELRLLPKGSYEKIVQSRLRPQDLGPREPAPPRGDPRAGWYEALLGGEPR